MRIERIRCSTTDNYNYFIICEETREAAVVDPLDVGQIFEVAGRDGLTITHVLNTHTHYDHTMGNEEVLAKTGAELVVSATEAANVHAARLRAIEAGDSFKVGTVEVQTLHTPGHTPGGTTFIVGENLIVGDTLFVAGCGNPNYGGDVVSLFDTVTRKLGGFPDHYTVWPGHNYCRKNLSFALAVEPSNAEARALRARVEEIERGGGEPSPTTIAEERRINPFLRLDSEALIAHLRKDKPGLAGDARSVFLELRARRDVY
ncbi:MAG: MBL fold metallo-hydrolase [Myxococcales bacterium]|nr:MBL fold metallo-hydrolase [Myxococcales bacterium]